MTEPEKAERRARTTTERMVDLRDTVKKNVDKYRQKEMKLAQELNTLRGAREAGEAELERIDATLPEDLRLGRGMQSPSEPRASEHRADGYNAAAAQ
jgi:hypothetical protein